MISSPALSKTNHRFATSSHIVEHYLHLFPHTLSFKRGQLSHWPALEMTIQAHKYAVLSVAFSPDGQSIASALQEDTIRVWDAATGEVAETFSVISNVLLSYQRQCWPAHVAWRII
jgi:WD40 repeat protein